MESCGERIARKTNSCWFTHNMPTKSFFQYLEWKWNVRPWFLFRFPIWLILLGVTRWDTDELTTPCRWWRHKRKCSCPMLNQRTPATILLLFCPFWSVPESRDNVLFCFLPPKSRHFEELVPLLILESNPTTPSSRVNVQFDDNPTKIQFICLVSICDCYFKNHFGHFLKFIGLGNNVQIKLSDSYRIIFDHFQSFSLFFGGLEMT